MHFFSSFWQVIMILPCYIHSIYIFCIIYMLWWWHFLNYTYLHVHWSIIGGKMNQFGGKSKQKVELRRDHGVCFFQVWLHTANFTVQTSQYKFHSTNITLKTANCTLHIAHYKLHTTHCQLHTTNCTTHLYIIWTYIYFPLLPPISTGVYLIQCSAVQEIAVQYRAV